MRTGIMLRITLALGLVVFWVSDSAWVFAQPPGAAPRQGPPPLIHPQPNNTHAGVRYEPAFATDEHIRPVIRCLEGPVPEGVTGLEKEVTLRNLCSALADSLPIPVVIDVRALEDLGLDPDIPIVREETLDDVTLGAVLESMLDPLDLSVTTVNGVLSITTQECAGESLLVAHYPLPTSIADGRDMARLVETIQATTAPNCWDVVGGMRSINGVELLPVDDGGGVR